MSKRGSTACRLCDRQPECQWAGEPRTLPPLLRPLRGCRPMHGATIECVESHVHNTRSHNMGRLLMPNVKCAHNYGHARRGAPHAGRSPCGEGPPSRPGLRRNKDITLLTLRPPASSFYAPALCFLEIAWSIRTPPLLMSVSSCCLTMSAPLLPCWAIQVWPAIIDGRVSASEMW